MPGKRKNVGDKVCEIDVNSDQNDKEQNSIEKQSISESQASISFQITFEPEFWEKLWKVEQRLCEDLNKINFSSDKNIGAVYNPLDYAEELHKNYMRKYLKKSPTIVFLGMNPGLYGMCQTSVSYNKNKSSLN
jgi:hypothetical protein